MNVDIMVIVLKYILKMLKKDFKKFGLQNSLSGGLRLRKYYIADFKYGKIPRVMCVGL